MAQLDGFAHDLHAYFTTGVRRPAELRSSGKSATVIATAMTRRAA
jgi:hypothetical protein